MAKNTQESKPQAIQVESPALTLAEEKAQLEGQLAELDSKALALSKARGEIIAAIDNLTIQMEGEKHPHENQLAIQEAIQRSTEERGKRAGRIAQLIELGADPSELAVSSASPLDQSIAYRNRNKFPHRPMARSAQ